MSSTAHSQKKTSYPHQNFNTIHPARANASTKVTILKSVHNLVSSLVSILTIYFILTPQVPKRTLVVSGTEIRTSSNN